MNNGVAAFVPALDAVGELRESIDAATEVASDSEITAEVTNRQTQTRLRLTRLPVLARGPSANIVELATEALAWGPRSWQSPARKDSRW